jgi:hypothetical protein
MHSYRILKHVVVGEVTLRPGSKHSPFGAALRAMADDVDRNPTDTADYSINIDGRKCDVVIFDVALPGEPDDGFAVEAD